MKHVKKAKTFKVHDPESEAKKGDRVKIVESRSFSKDKNFLLLEVVK
jgi:small subunit ribosomal protein S17